MREMLTYKPIGAEMGFAVYDERNELVEVIFNHKQDKALMDELCHSQEDIDAYLSILQGFAAEYYKRKHMRLPIKKYWKD